MGMEFLLIGTAILVLALLMDHAREVTKKNEQIWIIIGVFFVVGLVIEYLTKLYLAYDAVAMIGQWVIGIWIFGLPIESYYVYLSFPYLALVIYYGYVKKD